MLLMTNGAWLQHPTWMVWAYLVKSNLVVHLQLLIQVLAICTHPLTVLKAPLNVGGVNEVVHVQHMTLALSHGLTVLQQLRNTVNASDRLEPDRTCYDLSLVH